MTKQEKKELALMLNQSVFKISAILDGAEQSPAVHECLKEIVAVMRVLDPGPVERAKTLVLQQLEWQHGFTESDLSPGQHATLENYCHVVGDPDDYQDSEDQDRLLMMIHGIAYTVAVCKEINQTLGDEQ